MSQAGNVWDPVTAAAAATEAGAELATRLRSSETLMEADAQRLVASLRGAPTEGNASLLSPQLVAELLNLLSAGRVAATPDSGDQPQRSRRASSDGPRSSDSDTQSLSSETKAMDKVMPQGLKSTSCRLGSPSSSPPPPQPAGARGRSPCRRRRRRHYGHNHGYNHGHRHGHSDGHVHEAGQDSDHEPDSEPWEDFSKASTGATCEGESSHIWHAHGHLHECSTAVTAHANDHNSCGDATCRDETCCRAFGPKQRGGEVRLNERCDFPGHCVKMKNTFIHIPCNDTDSDGEGGKCVVCQFARRSSSAGP